MKQQISKRSLQIRKESAMTTTAASELTRKHCTACEGGAPALSSGQVQQLLREIPGWKLMADGKRIRRDWRVKDFQAGLEFLNKAGALAEQEGHHPDLHLEGYRNVAIELWTHALGGLSENDFILAARIDQLPVDLKT